MPMYEEVVGSLNDGLAARFLRFLAALSAAVFIFAFYAWLKFAGFTDGESMEWAHIARQMSRGKGLATLCFRPSDFTVKRVEIRDEAGNVTALRDGRHAPLYPAVLSVAFLLAERAGWRDPASLEAAAVLPMNILIMLAAVFVLYGVARRLFGERAALLAVMLFAVCEGALAAPLRCSPAPLVMLLAAAALRTALMARDTAAESLIRRTLLAGLSGGLCGLAFLAGYSSLPFAIPCLFVAAGGEERGRRFSILAFAAVLLSVCVAWVARNWILCGAPFGFASRVVFHDTAAFPGLAADQSVRNSSLTVSLLDCVRLKIFAGLGAAWNCAFRLPGAGPAAAFFLVSFFHRFQDETVSALRWWIAAAFGVALVIAAAGRPSETWTMIFLPIIVTYAAGFFFELVEKSDFFNPELPELLKWALVLCAAFPAAAGMFAAPKFPYPPYHPPFISKMCSSMEAGEIVVTDIPWACAWYAERPSLLIPGTVEDLRVEPIKSLKIGAIFLTGASQRDCYAPEDGAAWNSIRMGFLPEWLPMTNGVAFPRGTREQVFISSRPIYQARGAEDPR